MTIKEIKALPDEFYFKSNINPFGLTYHAKKIRGAYEVKWDLDSHIANTTIPTLEFREYLLMGKFVLADI